MDPLDSKGFGERGVARAGGNVEKAFCVAQVERLDEQLRDDQDPGADHVVVAARLRRLLALFDRCRCAPLARLMACGR
jgi:hypothetical protein